MGVNPFSIAGGAYIEEPKKKNPFSIAPNAPPLADNDPFRKVTNITSAMSEVGVKVPERKPQGLSNVLNTVLGAGSKVLDVIDRPRNTIVTMLDDMTDGENDGGIAGVMKHAGQALKGNIHTSGTKLLDNAGWKTEKNADGTDKKWYKSINNSAKGLVGFVGDVLLDPTTYLSFGTTSLAKVGGKEALEQVTKSGLKESLEKVLRAEGKELTEGTVKDGLAKLLGKDTLQGVNAATLGDFAKTTQAAQAGVKEKLNRIVTDRSDIFKKSDNSAMAHSVGLNNVLNKGTSAEYQKFYDNMVDTVMRAPNRMSPRDKQALVHDILGGIDPQDFDTYGTAVNMMRNMTGKQLLTSKAIKDAFGSNVVSVDALKYGRTLGRNTFKDKMNTLMGHAPEEISAKAALEASELEVKYANGLSQVYNKVTGDTYMKFMGKEIMNINSAGGDALAKTINKIANFNPITKVADQLGRTFQTGYVSRALEKVNPERAAEVKSFFEVTQAMIQKETGIPKHALDTVMKAYDNAIIGNQKVRQALTYFIEREIDDGGVEDTLTGGVNYAAKKWEDIAKTLTPEEMALVEKGYAQHNLLMSSVRELDKKFATYANEVGDDAADEYVRHYYRQSPAEVEDIASAMTRGQKVGAKTTTQGAFDKDRRFKTLAQAEAKTAGKLKAVDDILTVDALRYMESWRVGLNQELTGIMGKLADNADEVSRIISRDKVDGFTKLDGFQYKDPHTGQISHYYVHSDVARELNRFMDLFINDQAMNKWLEYFDGVTNFIKTTQTSWNPSFLAKNVFGETFMNWMANVGPRSHVLAQDIMNNVGKHKITRVGNRVLYNDGKELKILADLTKKEWVNDAGVKSLQYEAKGLDGQVIDIGGNVGVPLYNEKYEDFVTQQMKKLGVKTYNIGGKELTADQILNHFYDLGLGWSGVTKGNLISNMEKTLQKQIGSMSTAQKLFPGTYMEKVGDWTETWTRLAHMVDRLEQGKSFQEAAMDVRKYHVDYRDLTPMERNVFRRIAPYYTYMRKNLPIQMRTMLSEPGKFSIIGRLVNMSYDGLTDINNMPDYAREDLAIPLYEDDDGNVTYVNWGLPITDLARLKFDLEDLWKTNVMDMLHPGIKAGFEIATNSNIGLGNMPIEKFEGEKAQLIPGVGQPVIPKKIDYGIQQLGAVQNIRKTLGEVFTQDDPMKPDSPIPMFGSVVKTVNPTQVRTSNEYQYADQLQSFKKKLEQAGIYVPDTETYERVRKIRLQNATANANPYSIRRGGN